MTVLFRLAEWHALAKLRMHTESTLTRMESVTTVLGCELRKFSNVTCSAFTAFELPKETAAHGRRRARTRAKAAKPDGNDPLGSKRAPATEMDGPDGSTAPAAEMDGPDGSTAPAAGMDGPDRSINPALSSGVRSRNPRKKKLNLSIYKLHSLGDYVRTICMFGTTDSYSTQLVSIVLYTKSRRAQVCYHTRASMDIVERSDFTGVLTKT